MVAHAVTFEPVSTDKFPANREKNREFYKIAALGAPETAISGAVTGFSLRIPYSTKQGICFAEQRIFEVHPRG
jgi:hypothetical protein